MKKIGIVALSSPSIGERRALIERSLSSLASAGYELVLGSCVFASDAYKSAGAEMRALDLINLLGDQSIDIILNTTGGYNSNEILEYLDLENLTPSSAYFVGYSDISAVSLALYRYGICKTVQGPMLIDNDVSPMWIQDLSEALKSKKTRFEFPLEICESKGKNRRSYDGLHALRRGKRSVQGKALVANLSTFCLLMGTPYLPSLEGCVLFLEYDKEESQAKPSLERFLWQLRQAGVFGVIRGLVFGALEMEVQMEAQDRSIEKILREVTQGFDIPVLWNAPFGHVYPSWIIVNGAKVELSA